MTCGCRGNLAPLRSSSAATDVIDLHRSVLGGRNQAMPGLGTEMRHVDFCHRIGGAQAQQRSFGHSKQSLAGFQNRKRAKQGLAIKRHIWGRIWGQWANPLISFGMTPQPWDAKINQCANCHGNVTAWVGDGRTRNRYARSNGRFHGRF